MKILALDQSINTTGYAVFDNDKLINYGTFSINSSWPIEKRLGEIWDKIWEYKAKYHFDYLVFENTQIQHGNAETFRKLCYVQAILLLWCRENHIKYTIYAPSAWRAILGKGWGKKREEQKQKAIDLVNETYNIMVNSDAADAICIGLAKLKDGNAF